MLYLSGYLDVRIFFIRNLSGTYIVPRIALRFDINDNVVVSSHVYV